MARLPYADQHAPIALREGMSQAQLDALQHWREADGFSPTQCAVLAYTDMMTQQVQVTDEVFDAVSARFPDGRRQDPRHRTGSLKGG